MYYCYNQTGWVESQGHYLITFVASEQVPSPYHQRAKLKPLQNVIDCGEGRKLITMTGWCVVGFGGVNKETAASSPPTTVLISVRKNDLI